MRAVYVSSDSTRTELESVDIITIDGPGGVGKTTVARLLAESLGSDCLDTGAMYRAIAYAVLESQLDPSDGEAVGLLASQVDLKVDDRVILNGHEITEHIRTNRVTSVVPAVALHAPVRAVLRKAQREWGERHKWGVVEGRDMGSRVFPDARLKIFLTATLHRRAERRHAEYPDAPLDEVMKLLAERDMHDTLGGHFALPDNGIVVDTTDKSKEDVVDSILRHHGDL